jgi:hypothetical protein
VVEAPPYTIQDEINAARDRFLEEMLKVPELEQALDHIPNSISSTALVMRFIDEEEVDGRQATNRVGIDRFIFLVELYCYGYQQREMQLRFESIILRMRQLMRTNPLLDRTLKKRFEIVRLGDPTPVLMNDQPLLRQRWRYSFERQVVG